MCVCVRKNKTLLKMNGLLLLCLPKPIGAALSMHGINRAIRSDWWTAGGWDNSQRLMLDTRDPWDYVKKKDHMASLLAAQFF